MIDYRKHPRTGETLEDQIEYDNQLIFHLDANGYGVYGVSKINGNKVYDVTKSGYGKRTWKCFKDEINNFIKQ